MKQPIYIIESKAVVFFFLAQIFTHLTSKWKMTSPRSTFPMTQEGGGEKVTFNIFWLGKNQPKALAGFGIHLSDACNYTSRTCSGIRIGCPFWKLGSKVAHQVG